MLTLYDFVYLITNLLGTYIIFKFMRMFLGEKAPVQKSEVLFYACYFLLSSSIYFCIGTPTIIFMGNLVLYYLLTLRYCAKLKYRILAVLFLYGGFLLLDVIASLFTSFINLFYFENSEDTFIWEIFSIKIISYMLVVLIENIQKVRKGLKTSVICWITIFLVPISCIYIFLVLLQEGNLSDAKLLSSMSLLSLACVAIFSFYDFLTYKYEKNIERCLLEQQNIYYQKQFDMLKDSIAITRATQQKLKKQLFEIATYADHGELDEVKLSMNQLLESVDKKGEVQSGNLPLDNLLNFKIEEAKKKEIESNFKVTIPEQFQMDSFDLIAIVGNLLDNAISITTKLKGNRKIRGIITYEKDILYLRIENTFDEKAKHKENSFITRKRDMDNQGIGFKNIERAVEKYQGIINRDCTERLFAVEILLYV